MAHAQISGSNFGHPKFSSYAVTEVVFFKDVCNAAKTQRCKDGIATGAECACSIVDHTHDRITITTPPGIGVERDVKVAVSEPPVNAQRTATTDPAKFNYDAPVVELVIPNRANAQGEPSIQVRWWRVGCVCACVGVVWGSVRAGGNRVWCSCGWQCRACAARIRVLTRAVPLAPPHHPTADPRHQLRVAGRGGIVVA